ncbi:formyltetrahydrofolate deformylase [Chitinivibrio alkaliphilus]|uniref:Formyltetrahydrofolate deformylase n=1 Tax=Chitinivibrio alkaliphilus ACht1 TaxID=1313304 RepID=U7DCS8_9BACT|nr:formyltetrahydrofolate deformylase [Chitinivibrio alkaliphilus]ERP39368.1 formyltetrahydrofolate deformylase [Chitinivibrio alkaliphilus ACht1]
MQTDNTAILLIRCADREGLISAITAQLSRLGANILYLDQHVDREHAHFYMRVEWSLNDFSISLDDFRVIFLHEVANKYNLSWEIHERAKRERMAIFVSRYTHCYFDLLSRWKAGELPVDIPLVISNHEDLREETEGFGITFMHVPVSKKSRIEAAEEHLRLLSEHEIDFVVLARYMQIVHPRVIDNYTDAIINIHHSFLPSFPGAKPYHQAYERGVKIIGATAHYVTEELDAGPIIDQDVERVDHKFCVADFVRIGQDVERKVLSRAVQNHIDKKVISHNNRTVVFS